MSHRWFFRKIFFIFVLFAFASELFCSETIVFIRHGEKPSGGLGQLSCKGLDRSLKLPEILSGKFGEPDFLLSPNPVKQKADQGVPYNYIRPLATIEPTAIRFGKNINLECGFDQIDCVANILNSKEYENRLVYVAWEHHLIKKIINKLSAYRKIELNVPDWQNDDFDSIYILKLDQNSAQFSIDKQGLSNLKNDCKY